MPHHPPLPRAPVPTKVIFDPFNSSSTGHQRAEDKISGSVSWRESRTHKLSHQLKDTSGRGGSQHLSDLVGAGSADWKKDGRKENLDWEKGAPGLREPGWQDIRGLMSGSRKRPSQEPEREDVEKKRRVNGQDSRRSEEGAFCIVPSSRHTTQKLPASNSNQAEDLGLSPQIVSPPMNDVPQIFRGLTMFLNGSTAPKVSDHKLKQLFLQHGGNASIALGRRTVTHVILGKTCGGGLASGKIHKEVTTVGGKSVKYVTAQWVLDSVEKGIRQPEGQYTQPKVARRIGGSGQNDVKTMFAAKLKNDKYG